MKGRDIQSDAVVFDLAALMRHHKVTIRDLSARMGVTMKAIRKVRAMARVPYTTYCDYSQGVMSVNVFHRARYDAMCRQAVRQSLPES